MTAKESALLQTSLEEHQRSEEKMELFVASRHSRLKQLIAGISATLGCLLNGLVMGYTGPALPSLMNRTETGGTNFLGDEFIVSYQEGSWIAGLVSAGCLTSSLVAGPCMDFFGRRFTLMVVTSLSFLVGLLLILFSTTVFQLYIGRLLNGAGMGFVMSTASVYIIEISSPDMRGYLGCFIQLMWAAGVLLIYILGCFLNWWQLVIAKLMFIPPFVIGMYFSPESPRWLFINGKLEEGRAALLWLRGNTVNNLAEEKCIRTELYLDKSGDTVHFSSFKKPEILKPFLVAIFMMFFRNMSGMPMIIAYCNTILSHSGSTLDASFSSMVVGIVLFISCLSSTIVISKFSRKSLLVASMFGMAAAFACLGIIFMVVHDQNGENTGILEKYNLGWLPCAAILFLLFIGNLGYGTVVWVVIAEILPKKVRSVGNSIIIFIAYLLGFISTKTFVDLSYQLGESGTFWLYSSVCIMGALYTMICVPETKGKTLQEIEEYFKKPTPTQEPSMKSEKL